MLLSFCIELNFIETAGALDPGVLGSTHLCTQVILEPWVVPLWAYPLQIENVYLTGSFQV